MRTIFILGAGASREAGAPLMGNFLETANRLLRSDGALSQSDRDSFDLVFRARAALQSVHSKASLNIDNLESLYGAFDMAALFGRLGNLSDSDVMALPSAIRRMSVNS